MTVSDGVAGIKVYAVEVDGSWVASYMLPTGDEVFILDDRYASEADASKAGLDAGLERLMHSILQAMIHDK